VRLDIGISIREVVQKAQYDGWGTAVGSASVRAPACPPHFTVVFVEVDVDTVTGEVKLVRAITGADVGTPISGHGLRGQMIGGLHMGLGYALTECIHIDPIDGRVLNPNFTDYKFISPVDMPQVETIVADTHEPTGPFGAKGIGEGVTNPVASAVANAIYNAIGVRIYSLPMTPEKILWALKTEEK
jgi:CO/xanthine dehydrogenase Mo-binding subunit